MRARHGDNFDFNDLYSIFLDYKKDGVSKMQNGELKYAEPPILMSFDKVIPDLIAKYHEDTNEYEVVKPTAHLGRRFKLYDDTYKHIWALEIPFTEVPELVDLLPTLKESLPFQGAEYIDSKYIYDNWMPMKTEKNGMWL